MTSTRSPSSAARAGPGAPGVRAVRLGTAAGRSHRDRCCRPLRRPVLGHLEGDGGRLPANGAHYLDITGEIEVLEAVLARDDEARDAGIVLLPGSGFDVVPTDCLAAMVVERLPDASALEIAFRAGGGMSPGTARTAVEGMGSGGRARVDGRIVSVPVRVASPYCRLRLRTGHRHVDPLG